MFVVEGETSCPIHEIEFNYIFNSLITIRDDWLKIRSAMPFSFHSNVQQSRSFVKCVCKPVVQEIWARSLQQLHTSMIMLEINTSKFYRKLL